MSAPVTSASESQIAESERGHRRGVVLGFTLAELLLLLLFCLLLITAGTFVRQNEELEHLREQAANLPTPLQIRELETRAADLVTDADIEELRLKSAELDRILTLLITDNSRLTGAQVPDEIWEELRIVTEVQALLGETTTAGWRELANLVETMNAAGLSPRQISETLSVLESLQLDQLEAPELFDTLTNSKESFGHTWPPIITLEDNGFSFSLGSAEIRPEFRRLLQTSVVQQLQDLLATYDVDVIEIVGHTDEQPINSTRDTNLDDQAINALWGSFPYGELIPVDNAGLGLARAIAVANILRRTGTFEDVTIIPMSAAQLVMQGDQLSHGVGSVDDQARRRIEIRLRRTTSDIGGE